MTNSVIQIRDALYGTRSDGVFESIGGIIAGESGAKTGAFVDNLTTVLGVTTAVKSVVKSAPEFSIDVINAIRDFYNGLDSISEQGK